MRRTKEQKGITLIALIITIVVLLILAVVAINSIQNYGIISHAGNTATTYNQAVVNEQQHLDNYLSYLDKIQGQLSGSSTTNPEGGSTEETTYASYAIGQKVKLKDTTKESGAFYVLEASDSTKETVALLAEYSIDTESLVQSETANTIAFSETQYWKELEGITYPYDLIEEEPPVGHYALRKAYEYGKKIGATKARLITYNEANTLKDSYSNMIYLTKYSNSYGYYWTCSAYDNGFPGFVWHVVSSNRMLSNSIPYYSVSCTVRPVVEISKDLVELVSAE